jgi:chromosome segregation ATPase
MKQMSKLLTLTLALFALNLLSAQEVTTVTETIENIGDANGSALRVEINRADERTIAKEWKSVMKDYDGDVNIKGDEIYASEVMISAISEHEIKVFAKISKLNETKKEFTVIFLNGDRAISSESDISGYTAAKDIVMRFAKARSLEATTEYKENQEDALKELEDNLDDLLRDKKRAEDDIEDCKETIKEKEYDLEQNQDKRGELVKQIEEQKKTLKNAKKEVDLHD